MGTHQPSRSVSPLGATAPTAAIPIPVSVIGTKPDQEKDDPDIVDGIMSQELMELSFQDRNESQEEIHGVLCLAPKETPELLRRSLDRLQWELDNAIPPNMKQAYLQSQHQESNTNDTCRNNNNTYVNTDEFRLRFLRLTLFDAPKASKRIVRFLDLAQQLFGDYALRRPIKLADFSKQELMMMRKGKYQFLPFRDRGGIAGRRILGMFGDAEWEAMPANFRNKMFMYFVWVAGNDVDTQREGMVFLVWFDKSFQVSPVPPIRTRDHELLSVRPCSIHCCSPDTPLFRFRRSIMTMRIGRHNRIRLITHLGESVELWYKLQSYGIPSDQIPITYAGKIKVIYVKQWMKLRTRIEERSSGAVVFGQQNDVIAAKSSNHDVQTSHKGKGSGSATGTSSGGDGSDTELQSIDCKVTTRSAFCKNESGGDTWIESPYISDIIFRKGSSLVSHPGNTTLRTLILAKAQKELIEAAQNQKNGGEQFQNLKSNMIKTRHFVSGIISDIRKISQSKEASGTGKACRFLVWNEGGWWDELSEEHEIYNRIDYIARGIRNTVNRNHRSCSMFTAGAANGKEATAKSGFKSTRTRDSKATTAAAAAATTTTTTTTEKTTIFKPLEPPRAIQAHVIAANLPIQHQNGGTSIFRFQDNSIPVEGMLRGIKKRRLLLLNEGEKVDLHSDADECFGMQFNSTGCWTRN